MLKDGEEFSPFHNVFPDTQSGKIELLSERLGDKYGEALPAYKPLASDFPLFLISPSSDKRINATFGGLSMSDGLQPLEMHPDDAASRNLDNGMTVRTWNDLGEVHLALVITDAVPAGTLYSPKGAWFRTSETGQTVSALISGAKADIAEGACYNDARVEVSALNH